MTIKYTETGLTSDQFDALAQNFAQYAKSLVVYRQNPSFSVHDNSSYSPVHPFSVASNDTGIL